MNENWACTVATSFKRLPLGPTEWQGNACGALPRSHQEAHCCPIACGLVLQQVPQRFPLGHAQRLAPGPAGRRLRGAQQRPPRLPLPARPRLLLHAGGFRVLGHTAPAVSSAGNQTATKAQPRCRRLFA